jgi:hypothetical protein
MLPVPAPTHDLVRLRKPTGLRAHAPLPPWVGSALERTPWVVVPRRQDEVPALAALGQVAPHLTRRGYRWGPGGSVAFEMAIRMPTATQSSDLDLILRAAMAHQVVVRTPEGARLSPDPWMVS